MEAIRLGSAMTCGVSNLRSPTQLTASLHSPEPDRAAAHHPANLECTYSTGQRRLDSSSSYRRRTDRRLATSGGSFMSASD